MKFIQIVSLVFLSMMFFSTIPTDSVSQTVSPIQAKITQNNSLTIYTYKDLMNKPFYDIAGKFSNYSGINKDQITITRFSDPYALMNQLIKEKDHPKADVVIGIDNALTNLFNASGIFAPYDNESVLANINPTLLLDMGPNNNLIPYDYSIMSLYYNNTIINNSTYPFFNDFTFDDLINSSLTSNIIIENPKTSTLGLGFLLWTIATYGDPNTGVFLKGFLAKDWHTFWEQIGKKFTIVDNFDQGYQLFSDPTANKTMIVSLTTAQAYDYCVNNITTSSSLITSFYNKTNLNATGWFQLEGLGMVRDSPNQELANKFMNWFLSTEVQNEIPTTQWKYPTNSKATIPACFTKSGIPNPNKLVILNGYANPTTLNYFLSTWIGQWDKIVHSKGVPGFTIQELLFLVPFFVTIAIFRKKNNT